MKFRNRLVKLHGLMGMICGLLLVIMGLTGSAIVFHAEIDHALNPHLMQVEPQGESLEIDVFFQTAQAAVPKNSRLEFVEIPQTPDESYKFTFLSVEEIPYEVFINPYSGKVLGTRRGDRTFIGFLYAVHHDLLVGKFGIYLVGVVGLILIAQSITGLLLWTGWRKLRSGFHIRWQTPWRFLSFDLHNVGGFIFNIFLLTTGVTGVVIVLAHIILAPPSNAALPPAFRSQFPISELLNQADVALPEGKTTYVSFPDDELMVIRKKLPHDHPRFYFSTVTVNGLTGKTVSTDKVEEMPPLWRFLVGVAALHFGTFGGVASRVFYVLIGFVPLMLLLTGLIIWKQKRLKGRRAEAIALSRAAE